MRAVPVVLFPVIVAVLAACSRSNASSDVALGRAGARDLTFPGATGERSSAVASAEELNRPVPIEEPRHESSGHGATAAAPKKASVPTPAPAPEVAPTPVPPPAEEVKPAPEPAPAAEPAPVAVAAPSTATVAVPASSGASAELAPGQSVTMVSSPMSGAAPANRGAGDMPEPDRMGQDGRRGGGIWIDDDCPHGRGGGGGVIGILR